MIKLTKTHNLHTGSPLMAHSAIGSRGWEFAPETLESIDGRPPNAVAHYRRASKRALLCRSGDGFMLAEYKKAR